MCKDENQLEAKKLYKLKLNETIEIETNHIRLDQTQMNSVFVPFNNEFM